MKPIPARRHHWAAALLVIVAAANTALTFRQTDITGDQANMLAEVFKSQDPPLYPNDPIFAHSGTGATWRLRLPAWRGLLSVALWLGGPAEPLNAFRLLGAATLLLYLLFMYVLLYRQTHSTSAAALVAMMSTAIYLVNHPSWGLGPIFAVTPATAFLAVVPLLALLFVRFRQGWAVTGVLFLTGIAGNVDLISAVNLTAVLLVALLVLERARRRAWGIAAVSAAAAAAGAAPALYYYFVTFRAAGFDLPALPMTALRDMLHLARMNVLYPDVLVQVLRWLPVAAVLAIPAAIILSRAGRYRLRELNAWLWLLAAALAVAFGLQALSQLTGMLLGARPPVVGFFQGLRLCMLPLYVLFAQAMVHLLRLAHTHRSWIRAALGVLAVVYLGFSWNTRPLRHMVRGFIAAVAGERPAAGLEAQGAERELRVIAHWADQQTPTDALFVTDRAEVRLYGRRSVLCAAVDVRYLYHLAPATMPQWASCLRAQRALLNPPQSVQADAGAIRAFVDSHWREQGRLAAPTYVLIRAQAAPAAGAGLEEVPAPGGLWGNHWRLLRVVPPAPASRPAPPTGGEPPMPVIQGPDDAGRPE